VPNVSGEYQQSCCLKDSWNCMLLLLLKFHNGAYITDFAPEREVRGGVHGEALRWRSKAPGTECMVCLALRPPAAA
jgi:hypothetical protein